MNLYEDIQHAIFSTWNNNTWLVANTHGLYFARAPKNTEFPYAVFHLTSKPNNVYGGHTNTFTLQFNIFSRVASSKETTDILEQIRTSFEGVRLNLTSHTNTSPPRQRTDTVFVNDTEDWQGTLVFELTIH